MAFIVTKSIIPSNSSPKPIGKWIITELSPNGGYVLGSVHNIQPEVPPENIIAMFEAAREYGYY